jgi:hypothetical protein
VLKFKNKYDSQFVVRFDHGSLFISVWYTIPIIVKEDGVWITFNDENSESQFRIDIENDIFQLKTWSIGSNILLNFKYIECKEEVDKFIIFINQNIGYCIEMSGSVTMGFSYNNYVSNSENNNNNRKKNTPKKNTTKKNKTTIKKNNAKSMANKRNKVLRNMTANQRTRYNALGTNENKRMIIEGVANLSMTTNEAFEMLNKLSNLNLSGGAKVRGRRVLKNGAHAGYVRQKDGSYKWRFLKQ